MDVYQEFQNEIQLPFPVISAKVNNVSQGLKFRLYQNRDVEFLDARAGSGHRVYVRSLSFVLYKATQDIFPGSKLFIEHSLCRGYYCNFKKKGLEPLTDSDVDQIRQRMKEIIDGTQISGEFKNIFACEYLYDENGIAVWPKTAVNYTNKTQFVYRINKGVLDVSNDDDLNRSMPDDSKRIPFTNMIYIGDGLSDVPCMKMMKSYGGKSIAVYQALDEKVKELLRKDRVDYIYPADYRDGTGLDRTVKDIIRNMAISDRLYEENANQLKRLT